MAFGPIVPTLHVTSMTASLAFYRDMLGFSLKWSWSEHGEFDESVPAEFACVECGQAVLFLSANGGGEKSSLFVELPFIEDVDALARRLQGNVQSMDTPEDKPWGSREFSLADPDGHMLRFSCPLNRTRAS